MPPTNTSGAFRFLLTLSWELSPFAGYESMAPSPVARMIRPFGSPAFAGWAAIPGMEPDAAARLPSGLMAIAVPTPELIAKMPGEYGPNLPARLRARRQRLPTSPQPRRCRSAQRREGRPTGPAR
jgi:hypothetical protein